MAQRRAFVVGLGVLAISLAGCGVSSGVRPLGQATSTLGTAKAGWIGYPDAPSARFDASGVVVGFRLFVLGGYDDGLKRLATSEQFTAFDKWSGLAPMPTRRSSLTAQFVPAARVLAIGGFDGSRPLGAVERYDIDKNLWDRQADMPTARWGAGSAAYGYTVFVAGGASYGHPVDAFESFDSTTNTWKSLKAVPTAREGCIAARLGERIVVVGGRGAAGMTGTVESYDPNAGTWTTKKPMPTARSYAGHAIYGHHLFVLGGRTDGGRTAVVESYDLATDTWTTRAPLPEAMSDLVAAKLGERMVVTGGMGGDGHASRKTWGTAFPF